MVTNVYAKVPHSVPGLESATKEDRNVKVHKKNAKMHDPCHGYLMFLHRGSPHRSVGEFRVIWCPPLNDKPLLVYRGSGMQQVAVV